LTWTLSGQILGVSERLAWESCSHAYGHSTDLGHALGGATMIRYLTWVDRALLVMLIAFVVAALGGCETPISRQAWVRDGARRPVKFWARSSLLVSSRPLVGLSLIATVVALAPAAHASPPDQTWIAGLYDNADYDDVILFSSSASNASAGVRR